MKKLSTLLLICSTLICLKTSAQVTLEQSYFTNQKRFYLTDIGNNNYKYVITEVTGVTLYNLDHTLYFSFVPVLPVWQPPYYYEPIYITKSLFDCDSTTFEYALTSGGYPNGGFYIYRTDNTLLFGKDSVTGPYCWGCGTGSIIIKPIESTPVGTKLYLFNNDSTWVYSLCGELPLVIDEHSMMASYVKVFPNPANGMINFEINPPNNQEKFILTIYNSSFQVVKEINVNSKNYQLDLNSEPLSSGTYLFDLRTDNKVFQTGKFVFTK